MAIWSTAVIFMVTKSEWRRTKCFLSIHFWKVTQIQPRHRLSCWEACDMSWVMHLCPCPSVCRFQSTRETQDKMTSWFYFPGWAPERTLGIKEISLAGKLVKLFNLSCHGFLNCKIGVVVALALGIVLRNKWNKICRVFAYMEYLVPDAYSINRYNAVSVSFLYTSWKGSQQLSHSSNYGMF